MEKRVASKLAKHYRVPISWIYKDEEYWENTLGNFFVSLEILKEDILKSLKLKDNK